MSDAFEIRNEREHLGHAPRNGNLRLALLRSGVRLYRGAARWRNCGGEGRCGTCRVRLDDAVQSALTPHEERLLDEASRAAGLRLACQVRVHAPVQLLSTRPD